jgi:hypothetical protein
MSTAHANGCARRFFINSEPVEYLRLPVFSGASVTPHRGKHERLPAARFDRVNNAAEQFDKTAHTATAGSDADPHPLLQIVQESRLEQSLSSLSTNVSDVVQRKKLGHMSQWWQGTSWKRHGQLLLQRPSLSLTELPL